jgi:hypothetical protein
MATRNDITGDSLQTSVPSDQYREGWDRIFKKPVQKPLTESMDPLELEPSQPPAIRPYPPTEDEGNAPD